MRVKELARFILERESIRIKKEAGKLRPWTEDPILGKYRFCNVRREDDAVTRWLRNNWYLQFLQMGASVGTYRDDVWFAAVVARLLNLPESLTDVTEYTLPFKPESFTMMLHGRKVQGLKNFNPAYIVSTNGIAMDKVDYLVQRVLGPLWANREVMRPQNGPEWTLERYHARLMKFDGLGSFIAAQVVADLKYMEPFKKAKDWWTFAASGPGSRRGLNRVMEYKVDNHWLESEWRRKLADLRDKLNAMVAKSDLFPRPLHAQDVQNCLCEFDKYERARLGEGTPKQIYKERV